jgi:ketosteroid isomerase-like protein
MEFMGRPIKFELDIKPMQGITETTHKNRAIIEKAYADTLNGHDTALWDLLDPDVEFYEADSLPYGGHVKGAKAAIAGVQKMLDTWSEQKVEIFEYAAAGDIVIAYIRMTATSRATGKVYQGMTAELFRFKDSKVIEWRVIYWDTHRVREVCGLT